MDKKAQIDKSRMIHIRLDEDSHRRLKTFAAQQGLTIQRVVEDLVRQSLVPQVAKKTRP